jgi:drug/metabolite transporter (DMT)-like permease
LFGLLTIGGTIIYHMTSRSLAKTESTMALLFYAALVGAVTFCIALPWNLPTTLPQGWDAMLILMLGALSMAGHFLFTAAYRIAPVSLLTPVNYMHLAWAALLSWLVFDHMPDAISGMGIALVAISGAGNALYTHMKKSHAGAIEPEEA